MAKVGPEARRGGAARSGSAHAGGRAQFRGCSRGGVGWAAGRSWSRPSLTGGPAARELLARSPGRFAEVTGAVADWLERWNRDHREPGRHGAGSSASCSPGPRARGELPDAYGAWLADRCAALGAGELPLVARHNDLTMWNVASWTARPIGVLDWAEAEDAGLPLTDFFYAVADAAAACDGYRDRPEAVRACFARRAAGRWSAPLRERLPAPRSGCPGGGRSSASTPAGCTTRPTSGAERRRGPFLAIMRTLAGDGARRLPLRLLFLLPFPPDPRRRPRGEPG